MLASCPSYTPPEGGFGPGATDTSFITCRGEIVIQEINDHHPRYYEIQDINKNTLDQVITTVDYESNFTFVNNMLFAFQRKSTGTSTPYVLVNADTGGIVKYNNFTEIPVDEQEIFKSLERGKANFFEELERFFDRIQTR